MCQFRFTEVHDPWSVGLRLFFDGGLPKGEVIGPQSHADGSAVDRCVADPETAFMAAIRIANTNDTEVVVSGDARLWRPQWGELVRDAGLRVVEG
jgi:hypothetical protein